MLCVNCVTKEATSKYCLVLLEDEKHTVLYIRHYKHTVDLVIIIKTYFTYLLMTVFVAALLQGLGWQGHTVI